MLGTPPSAAIWFLVALAPILIWVIRSDLKFMRIPNVAVLAMLGVFLVVGPLVLPLEVWGWRWLHLPIFLLFTFLLNQFGAMGAGDAKLLAASAPFVAASDYGVILLLFAALIPLTFILHRILRAVPAVRRRTEDWVSWARPTDFPMGVTIGSALICYLLLCISL